MVKSSKDKRYLLILAINTLITSILLLVLNQLNLLYGFGYLQLILATSFAVFLASHSYFTEKYASYFKKHSLIYKVISAIAFVFLIVAIVSRPTYYLGTILIGFAAFDMTLALLFVVINDQNRVSNRIEKVAKK